MNNVENKSNDFNFFLVVVGIAGPAMLAAALIVAICVAPTLAPLAVGKLVLAAIFAVIIGYALFHIPSLEARAWWEDRQAREMASAWLPKPVATAPSAPQPFSWYRG